MENGSNCRSNVPDTGHRLWVILALLAAAVLLAACSAREEVERRFPGAYVTPAPEPERKPFSMIWLSDTQSLIYGRPDLTDRIGAWIGEQKEARGTVCVLHTGDAVENGFNPYQWKTFMNFRRKFADLPLFMIAGNHDLGRSFSPDYEAFSRRLDIRMILAEFKYREGRALCMPLTVGSTDLLLIGAGWAAEEESAGWMGEMLDRYADRPAILLLHTFIKPGGYDQPLLRSLLPTFVAFHPNIRMILCGHLKGSALRTEYFDDDGDGVSERSVNIMLQNYQEEYKDAGQLRILDFDPSDRSVTVTTYSPLTDRYYRDGTTHTTVFRLEDAF